MEANHAAFGIALSVAAGPSEAFGELVSVLFRVNVLSSLAPEAVLPADP